MMYKVWNNLISLFIGAILSLPITLQTAVIKDDFQVNEEDFPATFRQSSPAVASDSCGNFIVVWTDERDRDWDIRARLFFADGTPAVLSFRVNDDAGMATQGSPSVACDYYGNFVVTWEDTRDGNFNIYARLFDNLGNPLGTDFLVNDDAGTENQYSPSVSVDRDGDFVITWMDYRNYPGSFGYIDIYAQRYDANGSLVGSNFRVNDTDSLWCSVPDVAMAPAGNFVITWYDNRNGDQDIIAQRYAANGNPQGANFTITLFPKGTWQGNPTVAMDGRAYFTFTWLDYRGGVYDADIWAIRYDNNGNPLSFLGFQVDDDPSSDENQQSPDISAGGINGRFTITWEDKRNGNNDVYAQRYDGDGNALGANFQVNDDATTTSQSRPSIGLNFSGAETFVWQDTRNSNSDIYGRLYDSLGVALGSSFRLNDDTTGAYQNLSDIANDTLGNFVIVWVDMRNSNGDIYGQRYNSLGNPLGTNFKINDDIGSAGQTIPVVGMADNGSFVVAWRDSRNSGFTPDIYAQRFDGSGNPVGVNFKVNDVSPVSQNPPVYIVVTPTGKFAISWEETKFYDENGTTVGTSSLAGVLDSDRNEIYYMVFGKTGAIDDSLFLQKFNSTNGNPIGSTVYLNMAQKILNLSDFDIGCDSIGNFVVAFEDLLFLDYGTNIYAHRFDANGNALGNRFPVNEDSTGEQTRPRVDMTDEGNFVIVWSHQWNSQDPEIYAQKYLSDGSPDGTNFRISNTSLRAQTDPSIGARDSTMYFCWTDNRLTDHGNDIFAKILGPNPANLELTGFSVKSSNYAILLSWKIESENSIAQFLILKREGKEDYKELTRIPGSGSSPSPKNYSYKDEDVKKGKRYYYRLGVVKENGSTKWYGPVSAVVRWIKPFLSISPNPFTKKTVIRYSSIVNSKDAHLRPCSLRIYDVSGRLVKRFTIHDLRFTDVTWDGKNDNGKQLPSGIYYIRLTQGSLTETRKILLVK